MNTQRVEATATRRGKWWETNFSDLGTRTAAPPTDRMEAIVGVVLLRAITIWFTAWGDAPKVRESNSQCDKGPSSDPLPEW